MNKHQIIDRLVTLPDLIAQAEVYVIESAEDLQVAKDSLAKMEGDLLLGNISGVLIDGKNAEQRQAQIREHTQDERKDLFEAETALAEARTEYNRLLNELKALQSVARLLGGNEEVA